MNNEMTGKWSLAPGAGDNAIGAALRRSSAAGMDQIPEDLRGLLRRLDRRKGGAAQAAMS